jgi:hypothetical protein
MALLVRVHPASTEWVDPPDAVWDEKAGEIRFRTRRPAVGRELAAIALIPGVGTRYTTYQWIDESKRLEAVVDLGPTGNVAAHLVLPEERTADWLLERRRKDGHWQAIGWRDDRGSVDRDFDNVPAGRFRLRDVRSGACSEEADVPAGGHAGLWLDLSRCGDVNVVVTIPAGVDVDRLIVRRGAGIAFDESNPRAEARGDQHPEFVVPGDRPVRITASHPDLVSDGEGEAVVTTPGDTVRLRLVPARK